MIELETTQGRGTILHGSFQMSCLTAQRFVPYNDVLEFEFIGVLRHMQRYFSNICDGTDVQADFNFLNKNNLPSLLRDMKICST